MDLVIFNLGQVTRTTSEQATPPNFPNTSTGERLVLDIFKVHRPLCTVGLQWYLSRTHDTTALHWPLGYRSYLKNGNRITSPFLISNVTVIKINVKQNLLLSIRVDRVKSNQVV
ncbi:hypothetical protein TNCV_672831 [Trichonephila clavipes]|nr:hypothetical protein TNCV_672831 [Trichonephila clavipes]